jgi:hypothetical protein
MKITKKRGEAVDSKDMSLLMELNFTLKAKNDW